MSLTGAIALSRWFGLSERVIGLTVMAVGTSLPELATSIQAIRKGQHDIAVANVIGSIIFNVFCILYYWNIGFIVAPAHFHGDAELGFMVVSGF